MLVLGSRGTEHAEVNVGRVVARVSEFCIVVETKAKQVKQVRFLERVLFPSL